ncbi:DNA-directed RNA polymerase II subunit RPB9 [Penicillium subrubescens]|uniref:DNA-directed RNA polymerase II subunit RPB9 n=1 Tax=Penicillium subrubescens TaxID=1316194 RepID=A0A1Q5UEP5_9EURO|nr:DNA-directed RNA polymerase II subunit RPB9 [Penicillium subrubescens]
MSASPTPSGGADTKPADQIHFRFCRECSNLLYPKEDRATNQLMFTCRTCHVGEPATSHCVYQNKLNSQVGDTAGVTQDVASDPTVCLPEPILGFFLSIPGFCLCCGNEITCETCGRAYYAVPKDSYNGDISPVSDTSSHGSITDPNQQA